LPRRRVTRTAGWPRPSGDSASPISDQGQPFAQMAIKDVVVRRVHCACTPTLGMHPACSAKALATLTNDNAVCPSATTRVLPSRVFERPSPVASRQSRKE
jgi:hypothetical protein